MTASESIASTQGQQDVAGEAHWLQALKIQEHIILPQLHKRYWAANCLIITATIYIAVQGSSL